MEDLLSCYRQWNHYGSLLEMDFEILNGKVIYTMEIKEKHLATERYAHGGAIASMMDAVLGVSALYEVHRENKLVATVEMKLNFIAPAALGDVLTGTATMLSKGNKILVFQGEIRNQREALIAHGTATFVTYTYNFK